MLAGVAVTVLLAALGRYAGLPSLLAFALAAIALAGLAWVVSFATEQVGVIVIGSRAEADGVMRFAPRLPNDTATLRLVCNFIIVVLAVSLSAHDPASRHSRVPVPRARADLAAVLQPPDVRDRPGVRCGPCAHGDRGLAGHGDGEAVAFEGWALVPIYVILATLTLYE